VEDIKKLPAIAGIKNSTFFLMSMNPASGGIDARVGVVLFEVMRRLNE